MAEKRKVDMGRDPLTHARLLRTGVRQAPELSVRDYTIFDDPGLAAKLTIGTGRITL